MSAGDTAYAAIVPRLNAAARQPKKRERELQVQQHKKARQKKARRDDKAGPSFQMEPEKTPEEIEIGTHGLYIAAGPKRAIILPQVAYDQGWTVKRFLEELASRAGLKRRAWEDPKVSLRGFTAQIFRDTDLT